MKYLLVKLVELMIVVAIIGTISVVGLDMYQDVSGGAKNNATKANHNSVVQYITLELMRCEMAETVMEGHLICSEKTINSVKKATIKALQHFKNPYGKGANDPNDTSVTDGGTFTKDYDLGYVRLHGLEDNDQTIKLLVGTCYAIKCYTSDTENNYTVSYIDINAKIDTDELQAKLKTLTQGDLSKKIEEVQKDSLTKKLLNLQKKFIKLPKEFLNLSKQLLPE